MPGPDDLRQDRFGLDRGNHRAPGAGSCSGGGGAARIATQHCPIPPAATASPARPSERINVEEALFDSIRRIESTYPGLRIEVTHRSGQVGTALEQSLDKAALLVLGSHHSEQAWSIRVGPIAEELMRRSPCPVMLVGRSGHQRGSN